MPILRKQVQISMHPTECDRMEEFLDAWQRRHGYRYSRVGGKVCRSTAINWLIKEQLRAWEAQDATDLDLGKRLDALLTWRLGDGDSYETTKKESPPSTSET